MTIGASELRLVEFVGAREAKINGVRPFEAADYYREMMREAVHARELTPGDVFALSMAMELMGGSNSEGREATWIDVGKVSESGLTKAQRLEMYRRARKFVRNDPMGSGLLRLMLTHVVGRGFDMHLRSSPLTKSEHPLEHRFRAYFGSKARVTQYVRKIIGHTLVNGSLYAVNFPIDPAPGIGRPRKRLLLPDHVTGERIGDDFALNPVMMGWQFGPLEQDETLKAYGGWVPAECVTDFHVHEDWNDGLHGISILYWLLKEMARYTDLLDIRENTARAEQLVLYIRYLTGQEGGAFREVPLRSGVMDANAAAEKWENLSPAGKGRDATADYDEIRNRLTQGQPFPAPMLTGDLRYAAQLGILGFPTQMLEVYQEGFTVSLQRHVSITVGCAEDDVVIAWPFVDMRDRGKIIAELVDGVEKKVLPRRVYHDRAGYDHEEMEAELARERKEAMKNVGNVVSAETISPLGRSLGTGLQGYGAAVATGLPAAAAPVSALPTAPAGSPVTSAPKVAMSLPAGLTSSRRIDFLEEKGAVVEGEMAIGVDMGYSLGGGIVLGGRRGGDIVIVGEVTMERLQVTGPVSVVSVCSDIRKRFPRATVAYVAKDSPEATHALQADGWTVYPIQESDADAEQRIESFMAGGGCIIVSDLAKVVQGELNAEARDEKAGMHLSGGVHVWDAARYLISGFLQRGQNGTEGRGTEGGAGEVPGGTVESE